VDDDRNPKRLTPVSLGEIVLKLQDHSGRFYDFAIG
jgi:hypothetical protein